MEVYCKQPFSGCNGSLYHYTTIVQLEGVNGIAMVTNELHTLHDYTQFGYSLTMTLL